MDKTKKIIKILKKLEELQQILTEDLIVIYGEILLKYQLKKDLYLNKIV